MTKRRILVLTAAAVLLTTVGFNVSANTPPVASFTAYRVRGADDAEILLDASASTDDDGQIVNYQWVFGDGATGSGIMTTHTYASFEPVNITLLTSDDGGSWHLVTKTIDLSLIPLAPEQSQATTESNLAVETPAQLPVTTAPVGNSAGYRAPEFELSDPSGELVKLSDFLGHVVLVEFWKSTCGGCQASTPILDAYSKNYTERGLVVVLIVLDLHLLTAQHYLNDRGYTNFVLLHETLPYTAGTLASYGVPGTPHAILIDRTGEIAFAGHPTSMRGTQIEALL